MTATLKIPRGRIGELVPYFLHLGLLGALVVRSRSSARWSASSWLSAAGSPRSRCEAITVCQSLPGPLAIQVGIFIAYLRGGFWGAGAGDVLAFDAQRQTLYGAGEAGQVSEVKVTDGKVSKTGESLLAPQAHVVPIHPMTPEIYFPPEDIDRKPVLRNIPDRRH